MWIVDSSVWIDYFNGAATPQTDILDAALGQRELGIGDLILCEVLQGFSHPRDFREAQRALALFPVFSMVGPEMALKSAQNYQALRRRGITVRKTMDCLIATFVLENGFALLHNDRDFEPFQAHLGLKVVETG